MSTSEIAKRYARALLAITKQKKLSAQALNELQSFAHSFDAEKSIREYFLSPLVPSEQKVEVLKKSLSGKFLEETTNMLVILATRGRLAAVVDISQSFQNLMDEEEGITRGIVRAAQPLSAEAKQELQDKITKILQKKIVLTFKEDLKVLGGVIAQVGGWTFDDSIETHLRRLNEELNRRTI